MAIHLEKVSFDEKFILRNLMELYLYDTSEFEEDFDVNPYGLFGYKYLDHYWTEEGRHAFFIKVEGKLAGFVLIRELEVLSDGTVKYSIAEFFVLRAYRRKGIGRQAVQQIWDMFSGKWSVSYLKKNKAAESFWRKIIAERTNGNFSETTYRDMPTLLFNT